MTEILSQDEIDALLSAISSGEVSESDYASVSETKKVRSTILNVRINFQKTKSVLYK